MKILMIVFAVLACAGTPAAAQTSDKDKAQAHYKRALAYEELEQWTNAIAEYEAAHRLFPDPEFHFLIAELYVKLDEKEKALARYEQYLKESPNGRVEAKAKREAERLRSEGTVATATAEPKPAQTEPTPAPGPKPAATTPVVEPRSASSVPPPVEPSTLPNPGEDTRPSEQQVRRRNLRNGAIATTAIGGGLLVTGLYLAGNESPVTTTAKVTIGLGAASAAVGLALFVVHSRMKEEPTVAIVPSASSESIGLGVVGRF